MTGKVIRDIVVNDVVVAFAGDVVKILGFEGNVCYIQVGDLKMFATPQVEVEVIVDDSYELQNQIETIRRWGEATVSIVVALFEPNLSEDKLEARCAEVADIIGARVLGNHGKLLITDDKSLKQMYKRFVEATLRWSMEKVLE
jgi:hypothetical protein